MKGVGRAVLCKLLESGGAELGVATGGMDCCGLGLGS